MSDTLFDKIVRKEIPSYVVWEDADHIAFLTPFPNTPGITVVIPKKYPGDDVFKMDGEAYMQLQMAVRTVADVLRRALAVPRVALVFEGTGVAYVHAKLYPLHGDTAAQTNAESHDTEFTAEYRGYITTLEGPAMASDELEKLQAKIRAAAC